MLSKISKFYLLTLLAFMVCISITGLMGCTVSPLPKDPEKVLVSEDNPIFDKRFSEIKMADINLDQFWTEGESPVDRESILVNNKTFADITDSIKDGVVNIYTLRIEERDAKFGIAPNSLLPFRIPILSSLLEVVPFQVPVPFKAEGISLGSGFIINPQGFILTNSHVIHNATDIRVVLSGGKKEYPATIIGNDPLTDTALIKIDPDIDLTVLPLGDSDALLMGEIVIAMGNPLGLTHSVTSGLVSAKDRIVPRLKNQVLDFIQTDSAINPGSSGGPLLNMYGEVVGVNTAIISEAQLIGFAIPINIVKEVMPLLVLRKTERGWFGATARPLTIADIAEADLTDQEGVVVTEIETNSPASKSGLQVKDIIIEVNGNPIESFLHFRRKLLGMVPGQEIGLTLFRDGKMEEITSQLENKPAMAVEVEDE